GTLPLGDGKQVLIDYRYEVDYALISGTAAPMVITNEVFGVNPKTGEKMWSRQWLGYYDNAFASVAAKNLFVNPLLMTAPDKGVSPVPRTLAAQLYLQGVGFNYTYVDTLLAPPGFDNTIQFINYYEPDEWAARIDYAHDGHSFWEHQTFAGDTRRTPGFQDVPLVPYRSLMPNILVVPPLASPYAYTAMANAQTTYWNYFPCCFDLNGDGVSDIVYTTQEWAPLPEADPLGPYFTSSYVVMFDGKSGNEVYHTIVENGTFEVGNYLLWTEALGDVNGDGKDDFLLHQIYYAFDYFHNLTIRD